MIKTFSKTAREMRLYFIAIGILWIIYSLLTLFAPSAQVTQRFGISLAQVNLLRLTVLLPYLFIWVATLFAILQYQKYYKIIAKSPEGRGFKQLNLGLSMLLSQIIISPFLGLVSNYYPTSFTVQKVTTILRNDVTILLYLIAFYFFWKASKIFISTISLKKRQTKSVYGIILLIIVSLGSSLIWFITHNDFRTASSDPTIRPTYFINDVPIFVTIVIPYLIIWLLGLITLFNLRTLYLNAEGIIYKKAFASVAIGLALIEALIISLQFLTQATTYLREIGLGVILILVYVILLAISAGYLYFAKGAVELTRIEKI
jgi:hypothetical protein